MKYFVEFGCIGPTKGKDDAENSVGNASKIM